MNPPIIQVKHLSKQYESWKKQPGFSGTVRSLFKRERIQVQAVKDISFSVRPGECVGFIGPNGAGKTTTLKMLSGILWPTNGEARVLGHIPWKREAAYQRQFGMVLGQKNQLWWDLPARETFLLNKEIYDIDDSEYTHRIQELSQTLGVNQLLDIPVRKLSLGERMKCELMNALIHYPKVLLLDEPTIGLDVVAQQAIRDFLRKWNTEKGTTILLTSHSMADVEELCSRVIVIHTGELLYDGSLDTLVQQVAQHKEVTIKFSAPVAKTQVPFVPYIHELDEQHVVFHVPRIELKSVVKNVLEKLPVADLLVEEVPIEEIVRNIFRQQQ